jgi:hypothetical protein
VVRARTVLAMALGLIKQRDELVRGGYAAGFTKTQIHEMTGLARTTIDRILAGENGRHDDASAARP